MNALLPCILIVFAAAHGGGALPDTPFAQEFAEHHPWPKGADAPPNAVLITGDIARETSSKRKPASEIAGTLWVATEKGLLRLSVPEGKWDAQELPGAAGPVFDLNLIGTGVDDFAAATWTGVYRVDAKRSVSTLLGNKLMALLRTVPDKHAPMLAAWGPDGMWRETDAGKVAPLTVASSLRSAAVEKDGAVWLATGMGLYRVAQDGQRVYQSADDILSVDVRAVAIDKDGRVWAGCLGGIAVYANQAPTRRITPADGLPSSEIQCLAFDPSGRLWVGTKVGAARYDGKGWSFRHSRRWLLDDDVRTIAFDADGAAYLATPKGVSIIRTRTMTMAQKSEYFMDITKKRHIRAPYIVEKCVLQTPGDLNTWKPTDDDNDGSYTGLFCVSEAMRYAVTKDKEAMENADKAWALMRQLQTITASDGFIARSIVPADWKEMHDPNEATQPQRAARERIGDPRYKQVEKRWRLSKDGKWLWKGDTSSDEVTGHFYTYALYYDLTPDEARKAEVREVAGRLMDHLMAHDYTLVDPIDGKHTHWGVWTPERLNHDPLWRAERGINSLELLSFLKATYHITGNEKYQAAYLDLLHKHGFLENIREAKTYVAGWITHIDTDLLSMAYPALLLYEKDPELRARYLESLDIWYKGVGVENNPFCDFIYTLCTGKAAHLQQSLDVLRDIPLDLISWTVDQRQREDLRAVHVPIPEDWNMDRLVPPSECPVIRWDKNPWAMVGGEGGATEWAPTFWLQTYWLARYLGVIK